MCKGWDLRREMLDELKGTREEKSSQSRLTNGVPGARLSSGSAAIKAVTVTVCSTAIRNIFQRASTNRPHRDTGYLS
ncbi:hypothetical protein Cenrod_2353 [Candidatus Symbiobacter mobilis CR]|uniref:Uncharacterized protein n=1 Tax=Candidatus Symbiobacter mobilis CR TaxID=946483 RepID=U5NAK1_9BURK|nr:hypothetical protein Cenrod_2353 [Candidatus Symbiobacter mobilis CR]